MGADKLLAQIRQSLEGKPIPGVGQLTNDKKTEKSEAVNIKE